MEQENEIHLYKLYKNIYVSLNSNDVYKPVGEDSGIVWKEEKLEGVSGRDKGGVANSKNRAVLLRSYAAWQLQKCEPEFSPLKNRM